MQKVDFDQYAQQYDATLRQQLRFFEDRTDYFAEYKIKSIKSTLQRCPESILEYGCGTGRNLAFLVRLFPGARVSGCDISQKSLQIATANNPSVHTFTITEEETAPVRQFDLIVVANVFHHIRADQRIMHMRKLYAWLKPGGNLFVFEHNPFNPVTRYLVSICPFDEDAALLKPSETISLTRRAGFIVVKKRYLLFFPSFLKKFRVFEPYMENIPLGGQYSLEGVKP